MGEFKKHLAVAKEKLAALKSAYEHKQFTVVGDLATKVCEQLVEADAAKKGLHFGTHVERHDYSNNAFPKYMNDAMRKIWFAYGDLGYDGVNGKRAQTVIEKLRIILGFFSARFGEKIDKNF